MKDLTQLYIVWEAIERIGAIVLVIVACHMAGHPFIVSGHR